MKKTSTSFFDIKKESEENITFNRGEFGSSSEKIPPVCELISNGERYCFQIPPFS